MWVPIRFGLVFRGGPNEQAQDSVCVGVLWLAGLYFLHVPWAPVWAFLAALLQIVPHFGPMLGLIGPVLAATVSWRDWKHPLGVLILYAIIVVIDGLLLQPYLMRRVAKVPIWASILAAHRAWICLALLGNSAGAASARGAVRLQIPVSSRLTRIPLLPKAGRSGATGSTLFIVVPYITGAGVPSDHIPVRTMNTSIGSGAPLNCGVRLTGEFFRSAPQTAPSISGV